MIPAPERTDPELVAKSLSAAHDDYQRGDAREALKHLRKAGEVADEAGIDLRALALARAAADLATEVGSLTPPPASAASSTYIVAQAVAPAASPSVAPPPVAAAPAASVAPSPVASPSPPVAPPSPSVAPPPVIPAPSPAGATASVAPRSAARGTEDAALRQLLDSGRAVRVVVKRSARDEGLYIVRRAEKGAPAFGTREAVVVLLEPDDGFFE